MSQLAVVLLAAGGSRRMGHPKQLIELEGKPLIRTILHRLSAICPLELLVVLGAHNELIAPHCLAPGLQTTPQILHNIDWEEGLSTSIRLAAEHLKNCCSSIDHALFALVDQPFLRKEHYGEMIEASRKFPDKIIAAQYNDKVGAPMLFPKGYFDGLGKLKGDKGAGGWVRGMADKVISIDLPEAEHDWDSPEDLETGS